MRWIVRLVSFVLMLVVLAVGAFYLIPARKIADLAAEQFTLATGRQMTIGGGVVPQIWPEIGVVAEDVTVSNASWSDAGPMLQARRFEMGLDAAALLGGKVRVTHFLAEEPRLVLERSAEGIGNWEFGQTGGAGASGTPGGGTPFSLDRAEMRGGNVLWIDHAGGQRHEISGLDAVLGLPDLAGQATVELAAVKDGQKLSLKARVAAASDFVAGKVVPVALDFAAGAAKGTFEGQAGTDPLQAEGRIALDLGDLSAVSALAGIARPALPEGLGARQVQVAGLLTLLSDGAIRLEGAELRLDGNQLAGDLAFEPGGARPMVQATLTAGALDLSALTGGDGGSGGGSGGGKGWPKTPIDASGLGAVDALVALRAQSLDLGVITLAPFAVDAAVDRARAVAKVREAGAYGGTISGEVIANAREGFSTRADLAMQGMDVSALLTEFAGYDRLTGTGTLRLNVLGSGATVDALMKSLSGEGSLALGKGTFRGLDIAGMLMSLDPSKVGEGQTTVFDRITATFALDGGVLTNRDLSFEAPLLTATGAGKVDIGKQRLEYRIQPVTVAGAEASLVPVLISGPWASPSISLDLESLARGRLEEEKARLEALAREEAARLEAEARAKLDEALQKELGVSLEEGEDIEKAAKKKAKKALEKEAQKALEGLLGGN